MEEFNKKTPDLEDQFRDRRFILMMILLIISVLSLGMLFFKVIPEANQTTFGIISGIVLGWTADALKDYFKQMNDKADQK